MEMMRTPDIYRELYEEALAKRKEDRQTIMWLKQRARESARRWTRARNVGLGLLTAVNVAAWIVILAVR